MPSQGDAVFMRRALRLALKGWGQTAPNPLVGAVLTSGGRVVGEGYHATFGSPHAEIEAIKAAGDRARGATLFVNLEPCAHQGKTPACTSALIESGIARVVYAAADPNPQAAGGAGVLSARGIHVETGIEESAARELNAPFFHRFKSRRPWVTLKLAMSLDGAITDSLRSAERLTGPQALREVHRMRAGADAIAVGGATARADNPALTVRGRRKPRVPPVRVVFSEGALIPSTGALARTARKTPTWVVVVGGAQPDTASLSSAGVRFLRAGDLTEALTLLAAEGIWSLLVEGGAEIASALLDAGLVDRITVFRAPVVLGAGAHNAFATSRAVTVAEALRLPVVATRMFGGDQMTTYAVTSA